MTYEHWFTVGEGVVCLQLRVRGEEEDADPSVRVTIGRSSLKIGCEDMVAASIVTAAAVSRMLQTAADLAIAMKAGADPESFLTARGYKRRGK